jgi:hypothetical protein
VTTRLRKAAIVGTILADEDPLHCRLHVVRGLRAPPSYFAKRDYQHPIADYSEAMRIDRLIPKITGTTKTVRLRI